MNSMSRDSIRPTVKHTMLIKIVCIFTVVEEEIMNAIFIPHIHCSFYR